MLRREQMQMQLVSTGQAVKEKDFFCKSEFDTFEATVRQNFDPRSEANPEVWDCSLNLFCLEYCFKGFCSIFYFDFFAEGGVIFFTDPLAADDSKPDCDNIRIMIMTKVTVAQWDWFISSITQVTIAFHEELLSNETKPNESRLGWSCQKWFTIKFVIKPLKALVLIEHLFCPITTSLPKRYVNS